MNCVGSTSTLAEGQEGRQAGFATSWSILIWRLEYGFQVHLKIAGRALECIERNFSWVIRSRQLR